MRYNSPRLWGLLLSVVLPAPFPPPFGDGPTAPFVDAPEKNNRRSFGVSSHSYDSFQDATINSYFQSMIFYTSSAHLSEDKQNTV